MKRTFFVIALFALVTSTLQYCKKKSERLRNCEIEMVAFYPSGLRVSLPHYNYMQSVSFNGNINSPIQNQEIGNISKYLSERINGRWTFFDDNVQLHVGDRLDYWINVETLERPYSVYNKWYKVIQETFPKQPYDKTSLNHSQEKTINIILPMKPNFESFENTEYSININVTKSSKTPLPINNATDLELLAVKAQLNSTREYVLRLDEKMTSLNKELQVLKKMMEIPVIGKNIGTKLLLSGDQPPKANLVETIRQLVVEKLDLSDLDKKILQAYETNDGIIFEVPTAIDKQRILIKAATRLINSPYKIVDPECATYTSVNQTQAGKLY